MKKAFVLVTAMLLILLALTPVSVQAAGSLKYTNWTQSVDFTQITIDGQAYPNIAVWTMVDEALYLSNMGATYLISAGNQAAWTPSEFYPSIMERDMMDSYVQSLSQWPATEPVLINGKPWQETKWRDAILNAILASHPSLKDKITAFYADESDDGYAFYVFGQGMALATAKAKHNLEDRIVNGSEYYFYRSYADFLADGGDYEQVHAQMSSRGTFRDFMAAEALGVTLGEDKTPVTITLYIDDPVIHVEKNGVTQDITLDAAAWNPSGTTFVPVRGIFEAMGAAVSWEPDGKYVWLRKGNEDVRMQLGSTQATVSKPYQVYTLTAPPQLHDGRTVVPLRFISEALGYTVTWRAEEPKKIVITSK